MIIQLKESCMIINWFLQTSACGLTLANAVVKTGKVASYSLSSLCGNFLFSTGIFHDQSQMKDAVLAARSLQSKNEDDDTKTNVGRGEGKYYKIQFGTVQYFFCGLLFVCDTTFSLLPSFPSPGSLLQL